MASESIETAPRTGVSRFSHRRRTVSVRVLMASLVLVVVTAPSLYLLRKWQLSRTATAYLDRASELEHKQEWLAAADYITRFLILRPRDADAEVRLAETFANGADSPARTRRAVALYYLALGNELKERQWPLRQKLADLLLQTGRFSEAEAESRKLLVHDPASPRAHKTLALALYGQVETGALKASAQAELKKLAVLATIDSVRKLQPKDIDVAMAQAALLRRHPELISVEQPKWTQAQRHQSADLCLDELIAADPGNPKAYLARFAYRQQFALANADADIAKALELAPKDAAVLAAAGAAELAIARKLRATTGVKDDAVAHAAKAVTHLQTLLAGQPDAARPIHYLWLGEAQLLADKHDDAIATWKNGIKKFTGGELAFEAQLADAYLDLNRLQDAEQALAQVDRQMDQASARLSGKELATLTAAQEFRRSRLAFQRNDLVSAIPQLQRAAAKHGAGSADSEIALRALVMLGQAYSTLGQWREAAQAYDEVCQRNPRLAQVRLAAAQSWLAAGRAQLAAERAEQSLALRDSTEAWFTITVAMYRQEVTLAKEARDWSRFDLALSELEKRNQDDPLGQPWQIGLVKFDAMIARGEEAGGPQDPLKPQQVLRDLEAGYPQDTQLWARLPLAWQRLQMPAEADRCLAHLRSLPEGELVAPPIQARLFRARNEHQQADKLLASLVGTSPAAQRSGLLREWVNLKLAMGDLDGARELLVKDRDLHSGDLTTLLLLAELEIQAGRWAEAQKCEEQLNRLPHPAGLHARVLRARRLLASSQSVSDAAFAQAETEVQRLSDQAPSWSEVASLAGAIAQRRENLEEAALQYSEAVRLGEQRLAVFENLIAVLERLGRLSQAQEYLQQLESQIPLSQALTVLQGTVEMRLDQPERALTAARKAVEQRPQDVQARLWLARLLTLHQQQDEAEQELKRTLEMAPQDMRVWSALELFYVHAQKTDTAIRMADQIQKQQNLPEAERYFIAAQVFELAGKRDLAEESFRRAAAADPKNASIHFRMAEFYLQTDSQKAQACLEKTLELQPQHRSARRTLATVLASRGGETDWAAAESLLTGQIQDQRESAGDIRLHAVLLARRSGNESLDRSAKLLEQLVKSTASVPLDRLLLAQVYERQALSLVDEKVKAKKLDQARRELEFLANRSQADWSHFTAMIEFLDRCRSKPEIDEWLDRFQDFMSGQPKPPPEAILQLVRLQLKNQAAAQSGKWLDRLETMKADPLTTLLLRAEWCSQQGQTEQIRQRVDAQGEALLSQAQSDADKARIMSGIAAIYRAVKQLNDAERWERRLAGHEPKRYQGLAAVLTQQGKWSEAVALCRQAAQTDKTARPALVALTCLSSTQVTDERVADCEPLIQSALKNNPANAELHYSLGVVRVVQKRIADAIAQFREVVNVEPRHVPALNNLALLLSVDASTRKEAQAMIDRAIDLAGLTPDLCDTKGTILLLDGQTDEAVRLLEMATQGPNVDPRFEFHLALAYDDQGNRERAREHLAKAVGGRLEEQILTEWDQRMVAQLRKNLGTSSPSNLGSTP